MFNEVPSIGVEPMFNRKPLLKKQTCISCDNRSTGIGAFTLRNFSFLLYVLSFTVLADDKIKISGFANTGVSITDNETPYLKSGFDDNLNYVSNTLFGLQVDSKLDNAMHFSSQLIAKDVNEFSVDAEWVYLTMQVSPTFKLRSGRLRIPGFLYSQTIYVGNSYYWIRPPELVYETVPVTRFTGIDSLWYLPTSEGTWLINPAVGQIKDDFEYQQGKISGNSEDFVLLQLRYEGENLTFQWVSVTMDLEILAELPGLPLYQFEARLTQHAAAVNYEWSNLNFTLEALDIDQGVASPATARSAYISLAYTDFPKTYAITYQWRESPDEAAAIPLNATTIGFNFAYRHSFNLVSKFEWQHGEAEEGTHGAFQNILVVPEDNTVNLVSYALSLEF